MSWTERKAIEFKFSGLKILRGPGVYMYLIKDKAIYIGSASKLGERALGKGHHKSECLLDATSLMMFPCATVEEAKELEAELIGDLKPMLNEQNPTLISRVAELMGIKDVHVRQLKRELESA